MNLTATQDTTSESQLLTREGSESTHKKSQLLHCRFVSIQNMFVNAALLWYWKGSKRQIIKFLVIINVFRLFFACCTCMPRFKIEVNRLLYQMFASISADWILESLNWQQLWQAKNHLCCKLAMFDQEILKKLYPFHLWCNIHVHHFSKYHKKECCQFDWWDKDLFLLILILWSMHYAASMGEKKYYFCHLLPLTKTLTNLCGSDVVFTYNYIYYFLVSVP